jgi:hypothetical protein
MDSALALADLPNRRRALAKPRANSSDEKLLEHSLDHPILAADTATSLTGTTEAATYRALDRLVAAGVLEVLSESKRNRVWAATDVIAELDALSAAIDRRTTEALTYRIRRSVFASKKKTSAGFGRRCRVSPRVVWKRRSTRTTILPERVDQSVPAPWV